MTRIDLEKFVLAEGAAAWQNLVCMDKERGGDGRLRDTAVSLTQHRTVIAVHADYHDDDRILTSWFTLPEPLPGPREFLLDLHEWLEGRQPPPKLFITDPLMTLH
jgi:hypothetical protein